LNPFMKSYPVKSLSHFSAAVWVLTGLMACSEAPAPAPAAPQPILQGNQLRFPAGHPQLALLTLTAAVPAKEITLDMPAKLVWNEERTQRIYPAFAGRVASIQADLGQTVKAGSPLAQLASPDFGMAQADTAKALADELLAQKTLQRQRELFDAGIVARKDLEQAQADAERTKAERERASARTHLYGGGSGGGVNQQLGLKATINGIVVERNLNPGQELRPDQSGPGVPPLFVVSDPTSLWVQIDARESEAGSLRVGSTFGLVVTAYPGQTFEGKVTAASDFIDPTTRTIKVRGIINNTQRLLKAEMLATARVQKQLGEGVTVPASSVILRGNRQFVFVQVSPGVFEGREITRSYEGASVAVVSRGLNPGEQVVSENALLLGKQYRVANEEARVPVTAASQVEAEAANAAKGNKAATP
jgi:cobalt-zinc-cadmium efflux system membrane fusion protein